MQQLVDKLAAQEARTLERKHTGASTPGTALADPNDPANVPRHRYEGSEGLFESCLRCVRALSSVSRVHPLQTDHEVHGWAHASISLENPRFSLISMKTDQNQ